MLATLTLVFLGPTTYLSTDYQTIVIAILINGMIEMSLHFKVPIGPN